MCYIELYNGVPWFLVCAKRQCKCTCNVYLDYVQCVSESAWKSSLVFFSLSCLHMLHMLLHVCTRCQKYQIEILYFFLISQKKKGKKSTSGKTQSEASIRYYTEIMRCLHVHLHCQKRSWQLFFHGNDNETISVGRPTRKKGKTLKKHY